MGRAGAKDTVLMGYVAAQCMASARGRCVAGKGMVNARSWNWIKYGVAIQDAVPPKGKLFRGLLSSHQTPLKITRTPVHCSWPGSHHMLEEN